MFIKKPFKDSEKVKIIRSYMLTLFNIERWGRGRGKGEGAKRPVTNFPPVTSTNVEGCHQNFQTF